MSCQEFHIGDIGTAIRVTVMDDDEVVDISTASTLQITFEKPNGQTVTKTATLVTDGTDGRMKYITESGFLDQEGEWSFQGFVEIGTSEWNSSIETFIVYSNLGA